MLIQLHISNFEIFAKGDTYAVKDLLKHIGFRWDSNTKTWHRTVTEEKTLSYIVSMLAVNNVSYTADSTVKINSIMSADEIKSFRAEMNEISKIVQRVTTTLF